jgi:hypothetical protein
VLCVEIGLISQFGQKFSDGGKQSSNCPSIGGLSGLAEELPSVQASWEVVRKAPRVKKALQYTKLIIIKKVL